MQVQTILTFGGQCEEALKFYTQAVGAEVTALLRWQDSPDPEICFAARGVPEKIMHAAFRVGDTTLMATDGLEKFSRPDFKGVTLAVEVRRDGDARRLFAALGDGGRVVMPLAKAFWTPLSGMVVDRYGLSWMVNVAKEAVATNDRVAMR